MLYKNKKTGVEWEITNSEHLKRIAKDQNFEKVEKVAKKNKK